MIGGAVLTTRYSVRSKVTWLRILWFAWHSLEQMVGAFSLAFLRAVEHDCAVDVIHPNALAVQGGIGKKSLLAPHFLLTLSHTIKSEPIHRQLSITTVFGQLLSRGTLWVFPALFGDARMLSHAGGC
jgi:hypothetical protein